MVFSRLGVVVLFAAFSGFALTVSQGEDNVPKEDASVEEGDSYTPYQYKYSVKHKEKQLYFEKDESGDDQGKVRGMFSTLLADGRLLTVDYVADKDDGFVPKISLKDHIDPFSV